MGQQAGGTGVAQAACLPWLIEHGMAQEKNNKKAAMFPERLF
jgi:hypothetical protein